MLEHINFDWDVFFHIGLFLYLSFPDSDCSVSLVIVVFFPAGCFWFLVSFFPVGIKHPFPCSLFPCGRFLTDTRVASSNLLSLLEEEHADEVGAGQKAGLPPVPS